MPRKNSAYYQRLSRLGMALGLAFSTPAAAGPSALPACGTPGRPACPLQRWMRTEIAAPFAKKDAARLADGFERLAELNPDPKKWPKWSQFARDGARAAREHRAAAVIIACAHCHSTYRSDYNREFRRRALR